MKKGFALIILALITSTSLRAQKSYLGFSSGINNVSGMVGLFFETPIDSSFSVKMAAGIGSWGSKVGIAAKYYKGFPGGMSFGVGYSTASGLKNFEYEVELEGGGKSTEIFNLNRAHLIDLTLGKSWGTKFRFNIEFGYSIKISGGDYELPNSSSVLSNESKAIFDMLSPGGLILGIGLSFRLN